MAAVILVVSQAGYATVLYDFESGNQGWGAFGTPTTDSGITDFGSVGKGRFHSADFDLGGWGMIDVSPAGVDLSSYTGLSVDALLKGIPGYTPFSGTPNLDIGVDIAGTEYYASAVMLTDSYVTYTVMFADFLPGGADLSNVQIKLRMLKGANTGVAEFDYDQVTGVPEPGSLGLLALGVFAVIRRK